MPAPKRTSLEVLQRDTASRRHAPLVGDQAMRDPLTIGNKLTANDLGVLHARLLIRLFISLDGERCQTKAKYCQREPGANHHGYPNFAATLFAQGQRLNLNPGRANQL